MDRSLEEMLSEAPSEITYNPIYGTVAAGSFPDKGCVYKLAKTSPVQGEPKHLLASKDERNGWHYRTCSCGAEVGPFQNSDYADDAFDAHTQPKNPSAVQGEELPEMDVTDEDRSGAVRLCNSGGILICGVMAERTVAELLAMKRRFESEIRRLKGERDWRDEHDKSARISCTTLDPLTKSLDEMSDAELKEALEYSETCGCVFCFHNGYFFRLREALSASRADALKEASECASSYFGHEGWGEKFRNAGNAISAAILARMEKAS